MKDDIENFKDSNIFNTLEASFFKSLSMNILDNEIRGNIETLWKNLKQKDDNPKHTAIDLLHIKTIDL